MHPSMPKKPHSFQTSPLCSSACVQNPANTLAEKFSEAMGEDGQRFQTIEGVPFLDMLERISPWGVRHQYVANEGIARYELADGSAIIETEGCWDIEHAEHRFWMACGDPSEGDLSRHVERLERAGYCVEPAEIDRKFSKDLSK